MRASKSDQDWYDEFYKQEQYAMPFWYRFLAPELRQTLTPATQLVELGCGQAHILRMLAGAGLLPEENITAIDQSRAAVEFAARRLPKANISVGDLYDLSSMAAGSFDICLLMETIEHLENPEGPIGNIRRILKPGGRLYVSFPNYLHLPWLITRILAEKLNRPNWVVLQPVDKIYSVFGVIRMFRRAGFELVKGIGTNYGPPLLDRLETDAITRSLNRLGLWRFSFHPILLFSKPS